MAGPLFPVFPSQYEEFTNKCLFLIVDEYTNFITSANTYAVAKHNDKTCQLSEKCKFHLIIFDERVRNSLEILNKHCKGHTVYYQQVDCLYTLYKHYFFNEIVTQVGEVFYQSHKS